MKGFFVKSLIFLATLLVLDGLLFLFSFRLSDTFPPEEQNLLQHNQGVEGVILGTSHAEQGIIPSILEKETGLDWYNFARARRNLFFNYPYSKSMWESGIRPKVVVLVATYHDWNERTHPHIVRAFLEPDEITPVTLDFVFDRSLQNPRTWLLSDQYSSTHRMMMARSLSWLKNQRFELPFHPHPADGFNASNTIITPTTRPEQFTQYPWSVRDLNLEAFKNTLDFWTEKGIPLVVVDPPEYLGSRLSHRDYEQYRETTAQLCLSRGVPYKSFSDPEYPIVNNPVYFRDGDWGYPNSHLNNRGAALFTQELITWLIKKDIVKASIHRSEP